MNTYHIHILGQVQGVGFRPYVYVAALEAQLKGWVKNTVDGVHVFINTSSTQEAETFYKQLIENAPRLSIITEHSIQKIQFEPFEVFSIVNSEEEGRPNLMLTPDFAICPECEEEIQKAGDRRFQYPFITCTNCGPRYSITNALPYDRPYTTMHEFEMCQDCMKEYNDPLNRRYFSQTNSCPACAIKLTLFDKHKQELEIGNNEAILDFVVEKLSAGSIVAIKGIGGFLLTCDASNIEVIQLLRKRKKRPTKAFAVMFPDLDCIRKDLDLFPEATDLLSGPVSPIVLLPFKEERNSDYPYHEIAPGLDRIGVMLPYAPIYKLLTDKLDGAIIATSGNISNEPIVFENKTALDQLTNIADFILVNNRDIVVPQDDSVVAYSNINRQPVIYRRSRGLAPGYLDQKLEFPDMTILAVGAEMKSSFTYLFNKLPFISQYLGDLEDFGTQEVYQKTLDHFLSLFKEAPEIILHDKHPAYYSTSLAEKYGSQYGVQPYSVQHHVAHFAAILGEKHLFETGEEVLGVIWDGTGYGEDGQIWGGEMFRLSVNKAIERIRHVEYFDFILGDKMPKEPRISALSLCYNLSDMELHFRHRFSDTEWRIYVKLLEQSSLLKTSSMGRLFDAVSCLLLDTDISSYEGEAAMYLEVSARKYLTEMKAFKFIPLSGFSTTSGNLNPSMLMKHLMEAKASGRNIDELAYNFHCSLVGWVEHVLLETDISRVAFSGGVFQNSLLIELLNRQLGDNYLLYFHEKLSPNDECISFGQLMYYLNIRMEAER